MSSASIIEEESNQLELTESQLILQTQRNTDRKKTMSTLTTAKKREMEEIFTLFDTDGSASIDEDELRVVMRAMGFPLKPHEITELVFENLGEIEEDMGLDDFMYLMACVMRRSNWKNDLLVSFKLFSGDGKSIKLKDLKRVAKELGDTTTEDELQMMLQETDLDNDGEINEEDWIKTMTAIKVEFAEENEEEY